MSDNTRYKIVRMFRNDHVRAYTVRKGLTLEQAQEHCRDPETSSSTCQQTAGIRRTERFGNWFDGYEEE